jgi:hypothetical protein
LVLGIFKIGSQELFSQVGFEPWSFSSLPLRVARVTGMSHQCPHLLKLSHWALGCYMWIWWGTPTFTWQQIITPVHTYCGSDWRTSLFHPTRQFPVSHVLPQDSFHASLRMGAHCLRIQLCESSKNSL